MLTRRPGARGRQRALCNVRRCLGVTALRQKPLKRTRSVVQNTTCLLSCVLALHARPVARGAALAGTATARTCR